MAKHKATTVAPDGVPAPSAYPEDVVMYLVAGSNPVAKGNFGSIFPVRRVSSSDHNVDGEEVPWIPLVVKKMKKRSEYMNSQHLEASLLRESHVLRSLNFHAIPKVHAAFQDSSCCYLIMERIDGIDLHCFIAQRKDGYGEFLVTVQNWARQLRDIVMYLHERRVCYCDWKPLNIMIVGTKLYLVDFGLAFSFDDLGRVPTYNSNLGTLGYAYGKDPNGNWIQDASLTPQEARAVNWWGMGSILYQLVHGNDYDGKYDKVSPNEDLNNLIASLLQSDKTLRLGWADDAAVSEEPFLCNDLTYDAALTTGGYIDNHSADSARYDCKFVVSPQPENAVPSKLDGEYLYAKVVALESVRRTYAVTP